MPVSHSNGGVAFMPVRLVMEVWPFCLWHQLWRCRPSYLSIQVMEVWSSCLSVSTMKSDVLSVPLKRTCPLSTKPSKRDTPFVSISPGEGVIGLHSLQQIETIYTIHSVQNCYKYLLLFSIRSKIIMSRNLNISGYTLCLLEDVLMKDHRSTSCGQIESEPRTTVSCWLLALRVILHVCSQKKHTPPINRQHY